MITSTLALIAALGGTTAVALVVFRAMIGGTVSHLWKRYLRRKELAHEANRCPLEHTGWESPHRINGRNRSDV